MRNSLLTSKFIYLLRISIVTLYFNQTIKAQSPNNVNNINVSSGTLIFTDPNTIVSPSDNSNVQFSGSAQIEYKSGSLIDLKPGFSTGPFSGLGYFHGSLMSTQSACTSTEVVTNPYGNNGLGLTTLSPCSTYEITYTISSSAVATVEIDLPLGITYNSLPSQTHTGYVVTYFGNQGTGASKPIFDFTNAPGIVTFVITVNVPCSQTGSATTGIVVNGTQGCDPISQLQITLPILQVVAWPLAQLPANIASGSCGQLVYKLTNGGSGVMNYINVNLTGIRSNIILSSYYTDPTIGSIDMARCSSASSVVIASGATSIDLNNLNLGPGEFIFLHICYCAICHDQSLANALQNHIGNSDNSFVFNWGCSNGNLCSSSLGVVVNFSISDSYIPSLEIVRPGEGIPIIFDLSSYGFAPNITNSSLCDATISASLGTTTLYYRYTNNSILINNHTGAVNITDLKIYLSVGTVYGSIDLNSFKITTLGGYSVSIPFSTYFASASNPFISTGGETIVLDFSLLPSTFSLPNGPNGGLADVDGDHQVDDLAEGKSFVLSFDYNYSATCPPNFPIAGTNDNFSVSTCALYQNQCGTIPSTSNISTLYTGSLPYGKPYAYSNDGDVPPIFIAPTDVDATVPSTDHFNLTICPEFIQTFQPYYFNFDCLGGFHRISVYLPPGYHLDISSPLLPLIINTDVINSCHPGTSTSPETVTAIVTEIPAGTAGLADLCRGLVNIDIYPHSGCNLYSYYKIDCFPLPLYLDCPSSYCSVVSGPSTPADQFRFTLSNICNPGSCPNCIDSLVTKTTETVHHCYGPCAPVSGFGTLNAAPNDLFTFFRSTFGKDNSSNTTIGYDCNYTGATEVLTPPYDVAPIRTDAAYPGDEVQVKVNGTFGGNPANYSHICLQIRYDDLLLATGNNQIFDINAANSNIDIFDDLGNSIYTCPISAIHFSQFNLPDPVYPHDLAGTATLQGKDEMYFELDNLALGAMASFSISHDPINHIANFKFKANLHLIVRSHNTNTQGIYFNAGENPFQLRTEFLGFNTMHWDAATSSIIPSWEFSCDDWGNHFNILQPSVDFLFGVVNPTTCSPITATFTLRVT